MSSKAKKDRMSNDDLQVRMKLIVVLALAATLVGIIFAVLYSIMFVAQPLGAISPIDQKFFELIIPIATFITGTLSGILLGNQEQSKPQAQPEPEPAPEPEYIDEQK